MVRPRALALVLLVALFFGLLRQKALKHRLKERPAKAWVLLEDVLEKLKVDPVVGSSAHQEGLKQLLIGEDKEFAELLVTRLEEALCQI